MGNNQCTTNEDAGYVACTSNIGPGLQHCDPGCNDQDISRMGRAFKVPKAGPNTARASDNLEAPEPLEPRGVDFEAMGAIPKGWQRTHDPLPHGFLFFGLEGCLIAPDPSHARGPSGVAAQEAAKTRGGTSESSPSGSCLSRVLLAFPDWAVDMPRARWLEMAMKRPDMTPKLCRFRRIHSAPNFNSVVLEFDYPRGEALTRWLDRSDGVISEDGAIGLCRDLLTVVSSLEQMEMPQWGMLHPSSVFVNKSGSLMMLLPLGCLLSYKGALASVLSIVMAQGRSRVAPELYQELNNTEAKLLKNPEATFAADIFAVALIVVEAMAGGAGLEALQGPSDKGLGAGATDLLAKMLYKEHTWRLCGRDALAHPWLKGAGVRRGKSLDSLASS
mmetsp:Transcript_79446/g.208621  ORF Transcript_79446/g.208621 Transcript_79446/m.208621 type:complete len:388 (+) Transcript_79446:79-1242(+)